MTEKSPGEDHTSQRGFASMPKEKVEEIGRKGGHARAEAAGHEGMSAMGKQGGEARKAQLGTEGYREMGSKGGHASHGGHSTETEEEE